MLIGSSKALRCACTCLRRSYATEVPLPASDSAANTPRKWEPALPRGQSPLYDLALDVLHQYKQRELDRAEEARRNGSLNEVEIQEIEVQSMYRDPEMLWNLRNGLADYTMPIYRRARQQRWRKGGDLALVMQKLKDDLIIPDLCPPFAPQVEMLLTLDKVEDDISGGRYPGRPWHPDLTLVPPHVRAYVPHGESRLYTYALIDPDAPDEEHVSFQERWHWLRCNVPLSPTQKDPSEGGDTILPYEPPHPESGTPKHRYVLVLAEQSGPIDASAPYQRLGQLLWRSYLERHQATLVSAFHWVCGHNPHTQAAVSKIYKDVLKVREPRYRKQYTVDKYRLYGSVGRHKHDL